MLRLTDTPVEKGHPFDSAIFALIFCSFGPLAFFAPKGVWIPILLLLLVRSKTLFSVARRDFREIFGRTAIYLLLPAYAVVSAAWAVVPANAAITGAKLLGYLVATIIVIVVVDRLSEAERRSILVWAAAGLIGADLLVWADLGTSGAISGLFRKIPFAANLYSPGAAISACAILPIAVGLHRLSGPGPAFLFAGFCVATIFVLANEAAQLAAVFGILMFAAVRWRRALFWPVVLVPLAVGVMSPAFFVKGISNNLLCTLFEIKQSAAHRLVIYEFSSRKIFEKPLVGWGMDASRSMPGGSGAAKAYDCSRTDGSSIDRHLGTLVPLHPHNGSLQLWLELGAVGVVIFLGLLGLLIWRWQRGYASSDGRPLIAGLSTAVFLIYNISFGLWQGWLIFSLILICTIIRTFQNGVPGSGVAVAKKY